MKSFELGHVVPDYGSPICCDKPEETKIQYPTITICDKEELNDCVEVGQEIEVKVKLYIISKESHAVGGYRDKEGSELCAEVREISLSPLVEESGPKPVLSKIKELLGEI